MSINLTKKILLSYTLVSLVILFLGYMGYTRLHSNVDAIREIGTVRLPSIENLVKISASLNGTITGQRGLLFYEDKTKRDAQYVWIQDHLNEIREVWDIYAPLRKTEKEAPLWEDFKVIYGDLVYLVNDFISSSREYETYLNAGNEEALSAAKIELEKLDVEVRREFLKADEFLHELVEENDQVVASYIKESFESANSGQNIFLYLSIFGVIGSLIFGYVTARGLSRPVLTIADTVNHLNSHDIKNLSEAIYNLSRGELNYKPEFDTKKITIKNNDEVGRLAKDVNSIIDSVGLVFQNFETSRTRLRSVIEETEYLTERAVEGDLSVRGNSESYEGAYKDLVNGFNKTIDEITNPVKEGIGVLNSVGKGDLTVRASKNYKGDHKKLADGINQMADSIEVMVNELKDIIFKVNESSGQISSSTEEMAAGAEEQSAQAAEIASAVEQMTSTILQSSQNSNKTMKMARDARKEADNSGQTLNELIAKMFAIAENVKQSSIVVNGLGKSSEEIGQIIGVINEIADQTNLLALNAAIEAARAGENGRGFAVVADEVRKLAERTTKATKEIQSMIKNIQKDTNNAVGSIRQGELEVNEGQEMAKISIEKLKTLVGSVREVENEISQLAAASEEQSSAAEQISKNVEGISTVTHQTSAGAQQIAGAAVALTRMTVKMEDLIGYFKLSDSRRVEKKELIMN